MGNAIVRCVTMKAMKKQSRFTIADDSIDIVTRVEAWIVTDATIRAQHEAALLEQEFRGHVMDMREKLRHRRSPQPIQEGLA